MICISLYSCYINYALVCLLIGISKVDSFSVSFESSSSSSQGSSSEEVDDFKDSPSRSLSVPGQGNHGPNSVHEDQELREILCPGSGAVGGLLRYDLSTGKCSEIDSNGHCGKNMIFKEELDSSSYGYCECDFENHSVPLVYHPHSRSCYPVYKQGYCKPGHWLIISQAAKGPVCEVNRCLSGNPRVVNRRSKILYPEIWGIESHPQRYASKFGLNTLVPLNGSGPCVPLGSTSPLCNDREKIIIPQNDIYPRCGVPGKSFRRLSIIANACPPGSYYSIIGYCQPVWDF